MRDRRRKGTALAATLAAVALVAVASIAAANKPKSPISVATGTASIPGNTQAPVSAVCKKGSELTGLGFAFEHKAMFDGYSGLNTAEPLDERNLTVYFDNYGGTPRKGKAIAVCRSDGSFSTVEKSLLISTGDPQDNVVTAKCPRGSSVVGGGAEMSQGYREQAVFASRPKGKRGWLVAGFTYEQGLQKAFAICDKKHSYVTKSKTRSVDYQPRSREAKRTNIDTIEAKANCPGKSTIMSGGFDLRGGESAQPSVIDNRAKGHDAWFSQVRGFGFSTLALTTYAVCRRN
ncbi:hypothetical protein BH10ACT11_BH10ACT11_09090 [soil metagenome]